MSWLVAAWALMAGWGDVCLYGADAPAAPQETKAAAQQGTTKKPAAGKKAAKPKGGAKSKSTELKIDGSSTVKPISAAAAEAFKDEVRKDAKISVGLSGTGGGFTKFIAGEIEICDASRLIKDKEKAECEKAGIEYVAFTVAQDGLAIVVHKSNDWVDCISVEELKAIWAPEDSKAGTKPPKTWKEINSSWPDEALDLYGPGKDSGTFEFFTEVVVGKSKSSRSDYQPSENDLALVTGVANGSHALGYFGLGYYESNKDKLKLLSVKNAQGECVEPSAETVLNGSYSPLSRPLFIYVRKDALQRPFVQEFVKFYLENCAVLAQEAKYISPSEETQAENLKTFEAAIQ